MDNNKLLKLVGHRIRQFRQQHGLSQEEFAFHCNLDRTYISDIERGKRNVSLVNLDIIASTLGISLSQLFLGLSTKNSLNTDCQDIYKLNTSAKIDGGFLVTSQDIVYAARMTSTQLEELPFLLFNNIDLKALSGVVGAFFAANLADKVGAIVNPIEKGHPDIIPMYGKTASEEELRRFPEGLEIKCTVGNIAKGNHLKPGQQRLPVLTGLTWQAHHREVKNLMGLVIDFAGNELDNQKYPIITGIFYTDQLIIDDWGKISGTTGRNTKVTGMLTSGKNKMGSGWVILLNQSDYISKYENFLNFKSENH